MKVLKFGGTSVANADNIKLVKDIVARHIKSNRVVVVVSALGGITNLLTEVSRLAANQDESYRKRLKTIEEKHLNLIQQLLPPNRQSRLISEIKQALNQLDILVEGIFLLGEMSNKTSDKIVSFGELFSSRIISEYFISQQIPASYKDARELIITDEKYTRANVDFSATEQKCQAYFETITSPHAVVVPGFVAASSKANITTLGRGGSDYSGAIIAAAIDAKILEIWTDVSGVYTANPNYVKQAKPIAKLSYMEAMELSHFGAKVLYAPTIQPILKKNIPLYIKNTFEPNLPGTYISQESERGAIEPVKGISHIDNIALLMLEGTGMIGVAGISQKLFRTLSNEQINVILITQASSEHSICVCIDQDIATRAKIAVDKTFKDDIQQGRFNPCIVEKDLAILAAVGDGMRQFQGLGGKMFSALGRNNVNILAIAQGASERNISTVINKTDASKALNTLHECFFEDNIRQINLFVTGTGNVGQKFIEQIHQQKDYLKEHFRLNIRVIAISNSKKMYFNENGIDLSQWSTLLTKGDRADIEKFFKKVKSFNLRNSVFIDNTANADVSEVYENYLQSSIAVVTCNKIACSSSIQRYKYLKSLSRKYNAPLLFETNVGAALPIIDTLKNIIASGDTIQEIHAVLSGSLNFVFNKFNDKRKFHEVVKQAKEEGYTEPDPKIDLSGVDVARKILILVRESGHEMNIEDIENISFLPIESMSAPTAEDFLKSLKNTETHFDKLYENAQNNNCRLKYVATYKNGKAKVGLEEISPEHPFYNLEGKDNIVLFYTKRYNEQPLLIKGAGAGAEITASGIFSDIIRVSNMS